MTKEKLQYWESHHRKLFKNGTLDKWKLKLLKSHGFKWRVYDDYSTKNCKSYKESKETIRNLNIESISKYRRWFKNNKDKNLPQYPESVFRKEWEGWDIFLNKPKRQKMEFSKLCEYIQSLNIKTKEEYGEYWKSHDKPYEIPFNPDKEYDEWISWPKFLRNEDDVDFVSYEEAKQFVQSKGIINLQQFIKYTKQPEFPRYIPKKPSWSYRNDGYNSADFFGNTDKNGYAIEDNFIMRSSTGQLVTTTDGLTKFCKSLGIKSNGMMKTWSGYTGKYGRNTRHGWKIISKL